ncbi:MAG: DNA repair protein RecO [Chloroflexi bacterium]|nr:DNA repair protein RecO [Chloroflexota bacterium]
MDQSRFFKSEAIVLKYFPLGEADRVVTLYTPGEGKVRAVARGVRKVKSRLGGHLEPLTRVRVLIVKGKSLDVVSQAETLTSNIALRGDPWRTACGLYLAELVDGFTSENLGNPPVYQLLRQVLETVGRTDDPDRALRRFELQLLRLVGYAPELHHCVECLAGLAPASHSFSAAAGGILCPSCRGSDPLGRSLSLNALKVLRLFSSSDLQTAERVRLAPELTLELEHTIRYYLCYLLERELKSTAFLDLLRREREAGERRSGKPEAGVSSRSR